MGSNTQRYEHMWERDPALPLVIEEAWNSTPNSINLKDLAAKILNTQIHLKD
jgi:hypothetical protein